MSSSIWDWPLASAEGLLTHDQCILLLETDLDTNEDLLKAFPTTASKVQPSDTAFQDDTSASLYPRSPIDRKPDFSELAGDLLQQLDNQFKRETTFPNWFEEKAELPIFDQITPSVVQDQTQVSAQPALLPSTAYVPPEPTEELLQEFETIYDAVELTHLTPPQTPPRVSQLFHDYPQQAAGVHFSQFTVTAAPQSQWQLVDSAPAYPGYAPVTAIASVPVDYESDLKDMEEIVQMDATDLPSPQHTDSYSSASSSPRSSTDEEWSARPKPYSRTVDDRRSRKKEQNKNAATRYRQKKKAEIEVLLKEEDALRLRNTELTSKCSDLQREIRYLKGLMRDLFKAKGLIK